MAKTLKQLFQRHRRPGGLSFASAFLVISLVLLSQIHTQTAWGSVTKWESWPALWPVISLTGMVVFAFFYWTGILVLQRLPGHWREVGTWLSSVEYVIWFMGYVFLVPITGYLLTTIVIATLLAFRVGYRRRNMLIAAGLVGLIVVVVFKSFLQVKIPGGWVYEHLPGTLRSFMLTYF